MASSAGMQNQEEATKNYVVEDMGSYRDGFRNLMRLVWVQAFLILALTYFDLYYISNFVPQDRFFAVSPGGTQRPLTNLGMPNTRVDVLSRWTGAAVTQIFTFGFNDIDEKMAKAQTLFSPDGWAGFSAALFRSRMLRNVMNNQQIISAIPISAPSVIFEGNVAPGKWGWMMEAPMLVQTRAGAQNQTQRYKVRLIVVRLPTAQNPMGLGIDTLLLQ